MIRAVVFDLDDTLFPERQFVLSGLKAASDWLERECGVSGLFDEAERLFARGCRGKIFNVALQSMGLPVSESLVTHLMLVYREHTPRLTLFEDAAEALVELKGSYRLGLLTDGFAAVQRNKVAALGVTPLLDAVVYSDDLGRTAWKPSPVPYERVAHLLNVPNGPACLYVGDNPQKDFIGARHLGWRTVRIRRPGTEHNDVMLDHAREADACIGNMRLLPKQLERFVIPSHEHSPNPLVT